MIPLGIECISRHLTPQNHKVRVLGYLSKRSGDLVTAQAYYERALAIWEEVYGSEHHNVAAALNNLGALLRVMGNTTGAKLYYLQALAIWEKVAGPVHPHTAAALNNLSIT